jgi:hypothetical protein
LGDGIGQGLDGCRLLDEDWLARAAGTQFGHSTTALPLEECIVCLPQGEGPPLRLQSRIVRCVSLTPGFYDVGAKCLAVAAQGH